MPLNPLLFCVTHKTQPTEFQLQQACIVISRPNSIYRYFIKQTKAFEFYHTYYWGIIP